MKNSHKLSIALMSAVAIIASVQPIAVVAISTKVPSEFVVTQAKAEDLLIQGNEKHKKGDYQGAVAAYTQAIELNPNYAEAYYNRGFTRAKLGDKQGALADYNEALRINPNYAKAYYNRGAIGNSLGEKAGAIQDFQKAAELFQKQGDQSNYQKAVDNLKKIQ